MKRQSRIIYDFEILNHSKEDRPVAVRLSPSVTVHHRPAASDGRHGALTPRAVEIADGL